MNQNISLDNLFPLYPFSVPPYLHQNSTLSFFSQTLATHRRQNPLPQNLLKTELNIFFKKNKKKKKTTIHKTPLTPIKNPYPNR
jgi:hypothetical protein